MGMFSKLSAWLAGDKASDASATDKAPRRGGGAVSPMRPVAIDLTDDDAGGGDAGDHTGNGRAMEARAEAPAWSRQQLVQELQKNYAEVVELVRKVDGHLDKQDQRSARLIEIAERVPDALGVLPTICAQNAEIIEAAHRVADVKKEGDERAEAAMQRIAEMGQRQADAIEGVGQRMESAGQTDAELARAVDRFRGVIGDISKSSEARERELLELLAASKRSTNVAIVLSACVAAAAIVAVVVTLVLIK